MCTRRRLWLLRCMWTYLVFAKVPFKPKGLLNCTRDMWQDRKVYWNRWRRRYIELHDKMMLLMILRVCAAMRHGSCKRKIYLGNNLPPCVIINNLLRRWQQSNNTNPTSTQPSTLPVTICCAGVDKQASKQATTWTQPSTSPCNTSDLLLMVTLLAESCFPRATKASSQGTTLCHSVPCLSSFHFLSSITTPRLSFCLLFVFRYRKVLSQRHTPLNINSIFVLVQPLLKNCKRDTCYWYRYFLPPSLSYNFLSFPLSYSTSLLIFWKVDVHDLQITNSSPSSTTIQN